MPEPLTVIRTPHSRNPWRLAVHGQPLDSAYCWPTRRLAEQVRQQVIALADWTQPPATWDAATQARVLAVLEACDSALALRRLQVRKLQGDLYGH
jgi:hypothetical protein